VADLAVAILTGGKSARMGRDKAFVTIDGVPLVARVATAARAAGAARVVAVGGDRDRLRAVGLEVVADPLEGAGPLAGVRAAITALGGFDTVVVLPCDLASPSSAAIAQVAASRGSSDVAVPRVAGHLEPLHAAWDPRIGPRLAELLDGGVRSVQAAIGALDAAVVEGIDPTAVAGLNTPGEVIGHVVGQNRVMTEVPEIDVDELARRRATGAWVLDVRQPGEYETAHVPGSLLIPLDQLGERQEELPRDQPLLVICRSGARSAAAVRALRAAGYDATNVAGGMLAWLDAGEPVEEGPAAG
jgi:molybdopterin-guanine dinucleotide biosynthesis protein A/rhodanese-related sulfurtransferase